MDFLHIYLTIYVSIANINSVYVVPLNIFNENQHIYVFLL
ncbi:hypothetical protein HMPREF9998_01619 [Peptostreptococcus anaerobius VPI 4330 = DSM 2949]|nr:hypothetical protein HMPREF9998_01619 [Peptostreptococcus anaerobius VPI 4330 = DSM 2949]